MDKIEKEKGRGVGKHVTSAISLHGQARTVAYFISTPYTIRRQKGERGGITWSETKTTRYGFKNKNETRKTKITTQGPNRTECIYSKH